MTFLLDHPNPHGPNYYATRRGSILAAVIHVTAGLQGRPTGADSSAEETARYAATTDRAVSWHSGSDRDSFLQLLPDSYTAFHVVGYNSRTIGHEISKRDVTWADEDPTWVAHTLEAAAACLRPRLERLHIPIRRATKDELDRAILRNGMPVGLIGHQVLDPARRRDPGTDFPWPRFLQLLKGAPPRPADPVLKLGSTGPRVADVQRALNLCGNNLTVDGQFGPATDRVLRVFQQHRGIPVTGTTDAATWAALRKVAHA